MKKIAPSRGGLASGSVPQPYDAGESHTPPTGSGRRPHQALRMRAESPPRNSSVSRGGGQLGESAKKKRKRQERLENENRQCSDSLVSSLDNERPNRAPSMMVESPPRNSLVSPSGGHLAETAKMKRKREEQPETENRQLLDSIGEGFTPHIITVGVGKNIIRRIKRFTKKIKTAVYIMSAAGSVSRADLFNPNTKVYDRKKEGEYEISSLSGLCEPDAVDVIPSGISVSLCDMKDNCIGGRVGSLIADSSVQVVLSSYKCTEKKPERDIDLDVAPPKRRTIKLDEPPGTRSSGSPKKPSSKSPKPPVK